MFIKGHRFINLNQKTVMCLPSLNKGVTSLHITSSPIKTLTLQPIKSTWSTSITIPDILGQIKSPTLSLKAITVQFKLSWHTYHYNAFVFISMLW